MISFSNLGTNNTTDNWLDEWWSVDCCQQISTVEYVNNTKCRPPFLAADGHAETQRISESSHEPRSVVNWYGRSMFTTASIDVVYISRQVRQRARTPHNLFVLIGTSQAEVTNYKCARGIVLLKTTSVRHEASRGLSATGELHVRRPLSVAFVDWLYTVPGKKGPTVFWP